LREAGADRQIAKLLARDPALQVDVTDRTKVASLVEELREGGAQNPLTTLATRAANAGMLDVLFNAVPDSAQRFRFGRELDGKPSPPWSWVDLD
jgi:hypothetical protein